jgi:16S rRNA (guanine1516-N2)-methyltransferase
MTNIAVSTSFSSLIDEGKSLANQLDLPFSQDENGYDYLLLLTPEFLGLQKTGTKSLPLYVDFGSDEMNHRRKKTSLKKEFLARALGLKNNTHPVIVDATAGLGRDSFMLASLGFEIHLLEREKLVHALLADGIARGLKNPEITDIIQRMHLVESDAVEWLKKSPKPDLIYLDPMFPERRKTALVKKNMQYFQDIIGKEENTELLFQTALTCAKQRVVIKRPRLSESLSGPAPNFSLTGSSSRFDIYLPGHLTGK